MLHVSSHIEEFMRADRLHKECPQFSSAPWPHALHRKRYQTDVSAPFMEIEGEGNPRLKKLRIDRVMNEDDIQPIRVKKRFPRGCEETLPSGCAGQPGAEKRHFAGCHEGSIRAGCHKVRDSLREGWKPKIKTTGEQFPGYHSATFENQLRLGAEKEGANLKHPSRSG